jgi:MFS family permease
METTAKNSPPGLSRGTFGILFSVSFVVAIGNTGLITLLPAIGRQIGMPDVLTSAVFSLSALIWALMSPYWARKSDQQGRKPLIMLGLAGFALSMFLCGLVVSAGLHKLAAPVVIFGLFLVCRALFGLIGSASNPATQAYLAERTSREDRTQQTAALAGAFGLGTVIGPFLAPMFVVPILTLAGPLFAFSLIALGMLIVVARNLKEEPVGLRESRRFAGASQSSKGLWKDPRLLPFLIYGFLVATCQTAQGQTLGFMIIDKLHLPPMQAQGFTAVATGAGALSGLLAQWGLIRVFALGPRLLLRWGVALAMLGNLVTAFSPDYWTVVAGFSLSALGYGLARPGFTAGASLTVTMGEQAQAAGAIAAVNGINVIFAPFFVRLYEHIPSAPFLLNATILGGLMIFAYRNRVLRDAGEKPTTEDQETAALLERSDEGGL